MDESPFVARTERTTIERITIDDAPFFQTLVNTPDWLRYIGDRGVSSEDDARSYLEDGFLQSYRDHEFGYYLVKLRALGEPIGVCGFLKKSSLEYPDFGFALMPEYFGQGLALEFSRATLDYGIQEFHFTVLDAVSLGENARSIRLLEKLGFQHQGPAGGNAGAGLELFRWRASDEDAHG